VKRYLLAVSGLNPQVITETFYALHQQERTPDAVRIQGLTVENFDSYRNKINRDLENAFGPYEARHLNISSHGKRHGVRYGIPLETARIRIVI